MACFITVFLWGTTFISTKLLLEDFSPVEILFLRFLIGLTALWLAMPSKVPITSTWREELVFAAAGMCGICLYYLLENIALIYTMASNVGIIISVAPFFTGLLSSLCLRDERPGTSFYVGVIISFTGVFIVSLNGTRLELNPFGDLLALGAAAIWAIYSILVKKIGSYGGNVIAATRKIFAYGLAFMLPVLCFAGVSLNVSRMTSWVNIFNILFLGLGASALCFVTWSHSVKILGAVRTSAYIYMVPVITIVTAYFVLDENITPLALCGISLTLVGLIISENKTKIE